MLHNFALDIFQYFQVNTKKILKQKVCKNTVTYLLYNNFCMIFKCLQLWLYWLFDFSYPGCFLVNKKFKLRKIVAKFTEMKKEEENHAEIKISNLLSCSFLDRVPKFQAMECHYH